MLRPKFQVLLLIFVGLGIYYPAIFGTVNSVDDQKMLLHLLNAAPLDIGGLFLHSGSNNYYRPLLTLSFYADRYFWLLDASFLHLENVLLHLVNSLFVFFISLEVRAVVNHRKPPEWFPLVAATIFLLHPLNTEPVNWISGRTDVLAGALLLPATWMLLRGLRTRRISWSIGGAFLFFGSCLAKETPVFFFPAGAVICWVWNVGVGESRRERFRLVLTHYSSWFVALMAYLWMRNAGKAFDKGVYHVSKAAAGGTYDFLDGLRIVLKACGFYLKKFFVPWPLNFAITGASNFYVPLGVLVVAVAVYCLIRPNRQRTLLLAAFGLASSAVMVPLLNMTWTPLAERYMYLPGAFASIALAWMGFQVMAGWRKKPLMTISIALVLGVFAWSTAGRNIIWQSNLALFQDTDRKSPNYPPVRNELALALVKAGRTEEGMAIFRENKVRENGSERSFSPQNRALALWTEGQREEAGLLFESTEWTSSRTREASLRTYLRLLEGELLKGLDPKRKQEQFKTIARVQSELYQLSGDPFWLYRQGRSMLVLGEKGKAIEFFSRAYQDAPEHMFYKAPALKFVENLKGRQ